MTYCYSLDGEEYTGPFDTEAVALGEAESMLACDVEPGSTGTAWIGEQVPAHTFLRRAMNAWFVEHLVESVDEALAEYIAADDRIIELAADKHDGLRDVVVAYLTEHATFNRWGVTNAREVEITISAEDAP